MRKTVIASTLILVGYVVCAAACGSGSGGTNNGDAGTGGTSGSGSGGTKGSASGGSKGSGSGGSMGSASGGSAGTGSMGTGGSAGTGAGGTAGTGAGGTAGGPADAGPDVMNVCMAKADAGACGTCVDMSCCTEIKACAADPDCIAVDDCYSACSAKKGSNPLTCASSCEKMAKTKTAATEFGAIQKCAETNCISKCI